MSEELEKRRSVVRGDIDRLENKQTTIINRCFISQVRKTHRFY
jgi:hypothetical protein